MRRSGSPLEPVLQHVQEELTENLARARSVIDVRAETTGELERLADTLGQAAQQARAAAALRRRIRSSNMAGRLADRLVDRIVDRSAPHPDFIRARIVERTGEDDATKS
jgi:hypothetical protein